jgi:hypothetical protein
MEMSIEELKDLQTVVNARLAELQAREPSNE